jgi:hypothetical protein
MAVMDSGLIAEPVIGPRFARTRWRCPGMTIEEKFSFGINLICPVQSHLQKYSASRFTQIKTITRAVPAHRGAFRDRHGRWARDAVDAAASGART